MAPHSSASSSVGKEAEEKIAPTVVVSEHDNIEHQPEITTIISPYGNKVEVSLTHNAGVDQALAIAEELENVEIHPEKDKKLRRKLDWTLLPLFGLLYTVQFMDKTCISYASIMGIQDDLSMEGQMYSWTTSGFYLGYMCAAPFSAILLQKLPAVKTTSVCIVIWGLVQCLLAVCKSYPTFMLLRTLLGVLEAFVSPIFVIMLNQYYKKEEHFGRMAYFYGFNGLGTIVNSAIAGGLYEHKDSYSILSYDIMFVIIGLMTILVGLVIFFAIPNTPADSKWLSQEEIAMVVARIRANQQGFGTRKFKKEQVIECLTDIRTWIYFLIAMCCAIPNGGVSSYGNIIIKSLGYSTLKALWMKAPTGAFELTFLCILPFLTKWIRSRMLVAELYMLLCLVGTCLLAWGPKGGALFGIWVFGISPVGIATVSSCVTSNTAGHTKKLTANALSLMAYSSGNIIGPQTFQSSDAPGYPKAKATVVGCNCATIVLIAILAYLNRRENKRRDRLREELGDKYVVVKNQEFADLTDFQNPEFRYAY